MNPDNFVVRPKRRYVEQYVKEEAWTTLGDEQFAELGEHIAPLPTQVLDEDEEAKRFDLIMLKLQLARLNAGDEFVTLRNRVQQIVTAALREEQHPDGAAMNWC